MLVTPLINLELAKACRADVCILRKALFEGFTTPPPTWAPLLSPALARTPGRCRRYTRVCVVVLGLADDAVVAVGAVEGLVLEVRVEADFAAAVLLVEGVGPEERAEQE